MKITLKIRFQSILKIFRIFLTLFIITITVLVSNYIIFQLKTTVSNIKNILITEAENFLGVKLYFDRIAPNILLGIDIKNLVVVTDDTNRFRLGDVEIKYSLFKLITGRSLTKIITKVIFKEVNFNIENNQTITDLIEKYKNKPKTDTSINFDDIDTEIIFKKISINYLNNGYKVNLFSQNMIIIINKNINLNGQLSLLFNKDNYTISMNIKNSLSLNIKDHINYNGEMVIDKLSLNSLVFKPFSIDLSGDVNETFISSSSDIHDFIFNYSRLEGINLDLDIHTDDNEKLFYRSMLDPYIPDSIDLHFSSAFGNNGIKFSLDHSIGYNTLFNIPDVLFSGSIDYLNHILYMNNLKLTTLNDDNFIVYSDIIDTRYNFDTTVDIVNFNITEGLNIDTNILISKSGKNFIIGAINNTIEQLLVDDIYIMITPDAISTVYPFNGISFNYSRPYGRLDYSINGFELKKLIPAYNIPLIIDSSGTLYNIYRSPIIPGIELKVTYNEEDIYLFNIRMQNNRLNITGNNRDLIFSLNTNFTDIISGNFTLEKAGLQNINGNFYYRDKEFILTANDSLYFNLNLLKKNIAFRSDNLTIPFKESQIIINGVIYYNFINNEFNSTQFNISSPYGTLTFTPFIENKNIFLKDLGFVNRFNSLSGELSLTRDNQTQNPDATNYKIKLFLNDELLNESYSIESAIDPINKTINGIFLVTNLKLSKYTNDKIKGRLNIRGKIEGNLFDPNIDIDSNISNGKLNNKDYTLTISAERRNNRYRIKTASFQTGNNSIYINNSYLNIRNGFFDFAINGNLYLQTAGKVLRTDFRINSDNYSPTTQNNRINALFNRITLGYIKSGRLSDISRINDLNFRIVQNNNIIDVVLNNTHNIISIDRNQNGFDAEVRNHLNTTILRLNNNDGFYEINFIRFPVGVFNIITTPYVYLDSGVLSGNLTFENIDGQIVFGGKTDLYQGSIRVPDYVPDPINNLSGIISGRNNKLIVTNVNGIVQTGLVHGYGDILFSKSGFEQYIFTISSSTVTGMIKNRAIEATGTGDIERFIFKGVPGNFSFIGDLLIDSGDINLSTTLGIGGRTDPNRTIRSIPINVQLNFRTRGRRIKINYPLINGYLDPGNSVSLNYRGEENLLYLGGRLTLSRGEINYLNKTFKIESTSIRFFENEMVINPLVNINSFYRTRDSNGEPIKIYLNINDRIRSFTANFSSFPYKTQQEINGLLGLTTSDNFNIVENPLDSRTGIDSLVNTSNFISNSFLFSPIENKIREITQLDTFAINTNIFGNILTSDSNLFEILDSTSIRVGKYLTNEFYIESMMSFNKDQTGYDKFFIPISDKNYGLNLQLMLQFELQFMSIGYNYSPRDITNWLDNDQNLFLEFDFKF